METPSKIVACLLLNLALFLPCLSAAISSDPSFHSSMSRGPIHHGYTRFPDVERHCQSVLSTAADLGADAGGRMHQLSFMNGDWSQDAGQAPLLPFHGSYADTAAPGPELLEAVPLASFMLTHTDMAPRRGARTAFNVSAALSFTISRNSCCSYMEPRASPEFELRQGVARLHVHLQGVHTETRPSLSGDDGGAGGERVLCMVGDAVLPVRGGNSTDPWDWIKNRGGAAGDNSFEPPVVADGNILVVLRYPKTQTLTSRAVRGEMVSTSAESHGAYFDTIRLVSQSQLGGGYDSGYRFQPEDAEVDIGAGCSDDPLFHDGGHAMEDMEYEYLNRGGGSVCDIVYQSAPVNQVMEVIPNWDCEETDEFCSRVGPFETSRTATSAMEDMAFTRSAVVVQSLLCEETSTADGAAAARVAAVFRFVPPWEHQPTAASRTGLSGMTLSADGVWTVSTWRLCMVACLGVGAGNEACRYRVTLSVRRPFSMTRRGGNFGEIAAMDGSHPPLLFQQRVKHRFGRYGPSASLRMSYNYTKLEQARELRLRGSEATGFRDSFVGKSLLSYPSAAGAADDDMVSLSSLADNLDLQFCVLKKAPFVPEWMEETMFKLQILSIGTLVGSYPPQFQGRFRMWIELLGRIIHGVGKQQQVLNVSAELTASRNFFTSIPVMSLEGVYNPEDGRMHLIGCRRVHAPWRVLSKMRNLEDGMDCSIEVTVEYPATTTRWLMMMISQTAKVSIASAREEDDPLHFARSEIRTIPVVYRDQRWDTLIKPILDGLLCITVLSAAKIFLTPVLFLHLCG